MNQLLHVSMVLAIGLSGGMLQSADRPEIAAEVLAAQQQRVEAMRTASAATVSVFGLDGGGGGSGGGVRRTAQPRTRYGLIGKPPARQDAAHQSFRGKHPGLTCQPSVSAKWRSTAFIRALAAL